MCLGNIKNFKEDIYIELKEGDRNIHSLYYICTNYEARFGQKIDYDQVCEIFKEDDRFVFISRTQIMLKELLFDIVANQVPLADIDKIVQYIERKYYVRDVNKYVIRRAIEDSKNEGFIRLKYGDTSYDVKKLDDFIDVVIEEGYISSDAIRKAAFHFDENETAIAADLHYANAEIKEDYLISYSYIYNANDYDTNSYDTHNEHIKPIEDDYKKDKDDNILLLDLRTNELIASLVYLCMLEFNIKGYTPDYQEFLDTRNLNALKKLKIIYTDNDELFLTDMGKSLVNDINYHVLGEYVIGEYDNKSLSKLCGIYKDVVDLSKSTFVANLDGEHLWDTLQQYLNAIYLNNEYSRKFFKLLHKYNAENCYTLGEIIIESTYEYELAEILNILVTENANGGLKPLLQGKDICFKCQHEMCLRNKKRYDNLFSLLIIYRKQYVEKFMKKAKKDNRFWTQIRYDPIISKFITPYYLCNRMKKIFIKLGLIKNSNILYKDSGQYCPFQDRWVINNDILV